MEFHRANNSNRKELESKLSNLQDMCDYFRPMNSWLRGHLDKASDIIIAKDKDRLYGYIILDKYPTHDEPTHLELELICVGKEGQGKGVGTGLMKQAELVAKKYGLKEIALDAQFQAEGFYKKLNYKEVSRNNQGVRMKKILKG